MLNISNIANYGQFLRTNKELNTRLSPDDPQSPQRGFGLLEVFIAAGLAAFGLLAVGQLMFTSAATISLARSRETAALAAQNKLEHLSGLYLQDSAHADLAAGDHGPENVSFLDPYNGRILDRFRITWSIDSVRDPRPEWKTSAIKLTVAATPVRNDGTLMDRPYAGRTVVLPAVLGPQIK